MSAKSVAEKLLIKAVASVRLSDDARDSLWPILAECGMRPMREGEAPFTVGTA